MFRSKAQRIHLCRTGSVQDFHKIGIISVEYSSLDGSACLVALIARRPESQTVRNRHNRFENDMLEFAICLC